MNELCFASNLTSAELASWVQAVGAIAALFVAAMIGITQSNRQRDSAIKVQKQAAADALQLAREVRRDQEIVECMRVLLLLESYLRSVKDLAKKFVPMAPGSKPMPNVYGQPGSAMKLPDYLEVGSMAFLVRRNSSDVVRWLQTIDIAMKNVESITRSRHQLVTSKEFLEPLFAFQIRKGQQAAPSDWKTILSEPIFTQVVRSADQVALQAHWARQLLEEKLPLIRNRFAELYAPEPFPTVDIPDHA